MTKLAEWCVGLGSAATTWYLFYSFQLVKPSTLVFVPLLLVALVATVILSILIHRIRTFNDCPEAAAELRKQIDQARADLSQKGFKFE